MTVGREQYFLIVLSDYLNVDPPEVFTLDDAAAHAEGFSTGGTLAIKKGRTWLQAALDTLVSKNALEEIPDEFAGTHYLRQPRALDITEAVLADSPKFQSYARMGESGADWLARALIGIENADDSEQVTVRADEDHWEPLQFDDTDPPTAEAIGGLEEAVRDLAADNGFAATYPLERDAMLANAHATLKSVKNGLSTKASVRSSFVSAGRWLMDKFGGSAIGAIGAELVKWGLRLLGVPI